MTNNQGYSNAPCFFSTLSHQNGHQDSLDGLLEVLGLDEYPLGVRINGSRVDPLELLAVSEQIGE